MPTLQKTIRYGGTVAEAPVKAIDVQFQLPVHEYYVEDSRSDDTSTVHRRIVATAAVSITTSISAAEYRVELGSEFLTGKAAGLFQRFVGASKSVDNFTVGIDVVYFANGQFPTGKQSLELVFFPKFSLDVPQRRDIRVARDTRDAADASDSLILINKASFLALSRRLTAAASRLDPIVLLSVISLLTDTTTTSPELIKGLSADDTKRLEGMLEKAGVANPSALLDTVKTDFETLFDIPLTIPEIESVKVAGTLTVVTSDATDVTNGDFLAYDLSAQYSIRETGELQILRFRFSKDVDVQDNSAPFEFDAARPILRESVAGTISVQVKGNESVLWSREFKAADPGLDDIEISVPLQRANRVVPSETANVSAVPKKLRGQVLEFSKKCVLKDLTVVLQARTADDQPWRIVGAAQTDSTGGFSMAYPYGVFTAARAIVSLTPDDPVAVIVTEVRPVNQTISDDFLYLLVRGADCSPDDAKKDCDCDSPKKAARLPDYADLIGSDQYSQDIGGACVNLSTPNRTLSEFNYQAIVRTSDPEVANYTLRRVDPPLENVTAVLNRLAASNNTSYSLLSVLNGMNSQLNTVLSPMDAAVYARSNSVLASLNATMHQVNAALVPLPAAPIPSLSASLGAMTASATASDGFNAALTAAAAPLQEAINAASAVANEALAAVWASKPPEPVGVFDLFAQISGAGRNALFNPFNQAIAAEADPVKLAGLKNALNLALVNANGALSAALPPSQAALVAALNAADAVESADAATRYELIGGSQKIGRRAIDLDNPVAWNDAPEPAMAGTSATGSFRSAGVSRFLKRAFGTDAPPEVKKGLSFYQAVTVATGHILHYKSLFKADGYSLGDLVYSLPLAPGQKKQIVVLDASHTLQGAESQRLSQGESLSASIANERDILTRLSGTLTESVRGSSSANTSGISAGLGTSGQGYGGAGGGQGGGGGYGGSGSVVIGVAGGTANSNSIASQDSSRDVSEFFADKLRQSIMQNAESYRQLNASVVTTVQEGQRYGVTSEVVANHNHCHALTMMYFEVLRHYAIFQELSSVEECVFVPLLMTNFTTENIYKWRDVLASFLLPMPSDTYLQSLPYAAGTPRSHPLVRAFDANERIKTKYANVDFPEGAYDDEPIQFVRGSMRLTVNLPSPRTRYDRVLSFPLTKQVDLKAMAGDTLQFSQDMVAYSAKVAATGGIFALFEKAPNAPNPAQYEIIAREAIFDAFMSLDANYGSVAPADCIRIRNFKPPAVIALPGFPPLGTQITDPAAFFADNKDDQDQWKIYADLLGYQDVLTMLNAHFAGNLISEWDTIFYNDIAPLVFERIISSIGISELSLDFSTEVKYKGGERQVQLNLSGTTSRKRNQLPLQLRLEVRGSRAKDLQKYVTLDVDDLTIMYSTAHYNGVLFSGGINDDLLDGTNLYIPENNEEKRNPRKEDAYLQCKLIEHLNSHLEHYNKALWFNLDPDRRYMLLDGFGIQTLNDAGKPIDGNGQPIPLRSLASVVKNDLVTITGNAMVFPVAAGYRVSKDYLVERAEVDDDGEERKRVTLLDHYQPITPIEPYRISVPTRGVFCEAVQGACNACERIETERLQDWNKFPNPDEPTPIATITPPTPVVTDWKAAFKDFATPIVNIQNAPAAPAPGEGMAALSELLGKSGVFKDVTGLEGNQANVIKTYLSNQENAKSFAEMAKDMAMQSHNTQNSGKIMDTITQAKNAGDLTKEDAGKLVKDHLQQQIDGGVTKKAELEKAKQASPLIQAVVEGVNQGKAVKAQRTETTEAVEIGSGSRGVTLPDFSLEVPQLKQEKDMDCWAASATMMMSWKLGQSLSVADAISPAGQKYLQMYAGNTGLPIGDIEDFVSRLGMVAEQPASRPVQDYINMMNAHGPLWIASDADPREKKFSPHARILTKIASSSASASGYEFTFIDPVTGRQEPPETFENFIIGFEQLVTERDPNKPFALQIVHFKDVIARDTGDAVGGKPAPAHKTGVGAVSRLGKSDGSSSEQVWELVEGSKEFFNAIGDGVANWKDSPDADLVQEIGGSLVAVATEAALDAAKKAPGLGIILTAVEISKVIADAIGARLDEANDKLKAGYDEIISKDPGSNGYSEEDKDALRGLSGWMMNSVTAMRVILRDSALDLAEMAAEKLATKLTKSVIKGIFGGLCKKIVEKMIDAGPLGIVLSAALDAGREKIQNETKQRVVRESFAILLNTFIRQLDDPTLRNKLKGVLPDIGGDEKRVEKKLIEGLVGLALDPIFDSLDRKAQDYAYERIHSLFDELRTGGIAVEPTTGRVVALEPTRVAIPSRVLDVIENGIDVAKAAKDHELMQLSMLWGPLALALGARLTVVSRVRQKRIIDVYLSDTPASRLGNELGRYVTEMKNECEKFRTAFYAAAGEFAVPPVDPQLSPKGIGFQMVQDGRLQFQLFHATYDFESRSFETGPRVRSVP